MIFGENLSIAFVANIAIFTIINCKYTSITHPKNDIKEKCISYKVGIIYKEKKTVDGRSTEVWKDQQPWKYFPWKI